MNNVVFNTVASDLKATVYGLNLHNETKPLKIDPDGNVLVSGNVTGKLEVSNENLSILVAGSKFYQQTQHIEAVTGSGIVFDSTDISQKRTATIIVNNTGDEGFIISLQISPDGLFWIDDPAYSEISIEPKTHKIFIIKIFTHFARLNYNAGSNTISFDAYYNAQG